MSKPPFSKLNTYNAARAKCMAYDGMLMGETVNATQGGLKKSFASHGSSYQSGNFRDVFVLTALELYVPLVSKHLKQTRALYRDHQCRT